MSVAAGTSITMIEIFLTPFAFATLIGNAIVLATGSFRMYVEILSTSIAVFVVELLITGILALCKIVHDVSITPLVPMITAATLSRIIWLAQSLVLPGS